MITNDGELLLLVHAKGFMPFMKAMAEEGYLQSKLGTGARYCWVDRQGNTVDFTCSQKETKKQELSSIPKGFRGYKSERKFYDINNSKKGGK